MRLSPTLASAPERCLDRFRHCLMSPVQTFSHHAPLQNSSCIAQLLLVRSKSSREERRLVTWESGFVLSDVRAQPTTTRMPSVAGYLWLLIVHYQPSLIRGCDRRPPRRDQPAWHSRFEHQLWTCAPAGGRDGCPIESCAFERQYTRFVHGMTPFRAAPPIRRRRSWP
jgi:hypothetical protein